jgi:hypothetical protein
MWGFCLFACFLFLVSALADRFCCYWLSCVPDPAGNLLSLGQVKHLNSDVK